MSLPCRERSARQARRATRPRRTCRRGSTRSRSPRTACRRLWFPGPLAGKGHAAALAVRRIRHFEQFGDGHVAGGGDALAHVDARRGLAVLPARDGLAGDEQLVRQAFLREVAFLADADERVSDGHRGSFRRWVVSTIEPCARTCRKETRRCLAAPRLVGAPESGARGWGRTRARRRAGPRPGVGGQGWGKALEAKEGAGREEAQVRGRALRKVQGRGGGVAESAVEGRCRGKGTCRSGAGTRKGVRCGSRVLQVRARDRAPNARKVPS